VLAAGGYAAISGAGLVLFAKPVSLTIPTDRARLAGPDNYV
jgi:hypothetical protein